nr:DNA gyrase C-terminal beta-propeller domain-containing protein [Ktedonosporobacter rubrisoli]
MVVAVTRSSAFKALPATTFTPRGKDEQALYTPARGDEQLRQLINTTSQDYLLCVCSSGRVFQIATHRIPPGTRSTRGEAVNKLLELAPGEEVVTVLPIDDYEEERYLVSFSKQGKVKKSPLSEYKTVDVDGAQDMKLAEGDSVVAALLSRGRGEYFVTTDYAQTLRFSDEGLRSQGRVGQGVAAITLNKGATVVSAVYLDSEAAAEAGLQHLLVVTADGMGKKVPLDQYPQKSRAAVGVVTAELAGTDRMLTTLLVDEEDQLLLTWTGERGDQATVIRGSDLKTFLRTHPGVPLVNGRIASIIKLA